jgi:hypothetical protein
MKLTASGCRGVEPGFIGAFGGGGGDGGAGGCCVWSPRGLRARQSLYLYMLAAASLEEW